MQDMVLHRVEVDSLILEPFHGPQEFGLRWVDYLGIGSCLSVELPLNMVLIYLIFLFSYDFWLMDSQKCLTKSTDKDKRMYIHRHYLGVYWNQLLSTRQSSPHLPGFLIHQFTLSFNPCSMSSGIDLLRHTLWCCRSTNLLSRHHFATN